VFNITIEICDGKDGVFSTAIDIAYIPELNLCSVFL
jgi:hypothetical protein